jgi:integrase
MLKTRSGLPKHCTYQRDRSGKQRVRFRHRGVSRYLTGIPWSEDFMRQYAAALEVGQVQRAQAGRNLRTLPGSFSALCVSYYGSPEFRRMGEGTQRARRNILERFHAEHGHRSLKDLQRAHIRSIIGAMVETPQSANNLLKALRVILNYAVNERMIASNPALDVKRYPASRHGFHSWTENEIAQFQSTHPSPTRASLALMLALHTGQRKSDIIRMGWQHVRNNCIDVRQQKTGAVLAIPIHPALAAALAAQPKTNLPFLVTEHGAPFTAAGFGNWFRRMCSKAGLPHCAIHGLRKAACRRLAEAGCSANEIAAISGHASLKEVARYTAAAEQTRLASQAMARRLGAEHEQNLPNTQTWLYPTPKKL